MTTGAENDIRQATELARQMVGRFGMSDEIGFVAVLPQDGDQAYPWMIAGFGADTPASRRRGEEDRRRGPRRRDPALSENQNRLDSLAEALVRDETLDQHQAYAAAGLTAPSDEVPAAEVAPAVSSAT